MPTRPYFSSYVNRTGRSTGLRKKNRTAYVLFVNFTIIKVRWSLIENVHYTSRVRFYTEIYGKIRVWTADLWHE